MPWPKPLPLVGVKSKLQAISAVRKAFVTVDGQPCEVASITVNLQSRIFAVGEAGRAVVALLLGPEPTCGEVSRHDDMIVAYIALQNVFSSAKDPATFIADALVERPQVVVIDEGIALGGDTWARAFSEILLGDEFSSFQGAIVICCNNEDHIAQLHCSSRWVATGSLLRPEDVCQGAKFFDDVLANDADQSILPSLDEVAGLPFWENLPTLALEKGWKVVVLAIDKSDSDPLKDLGADPFSDDSGESGSKKQLLGFLSYQIFPGLGELHIQRFAVPVVHRRKGYGTQLLRWACSKTSSLGLKSVWLYTHPRSEEFYERFGFFNMGYMSDPSLSPEKDDGERYSWMMLNV